MIGWNLYIHLVDGGRRRTGADYLSQAKESYKKSCFPLELVVPFVQMTQFLHSLMSPSFSCSKRPCLIQPLSAPPPVPSLCPRSRCKCVTGSESSFISDIKRHLGVGGDFTTPYSPPQPASVNLAGAASSQLMSVSKSVIIRSLSASISMKRHMQCSQNRASRTEKSLYTR